MTFDLADLTALDLLDAELIGCVGADYGDNMVAAFQAQAAPPSPLTAAYDAARNLFSKPEPAKPDYGDNMVAAFQAQAAPQKPAESGPLTAAYDAARSFFYPAPAPAPAAASPLPGALAAGTRDESVLTDLEFSARHPERGGKKIGPDDTALAKEWLRIREDVVRPALAKTTPASPALTVRSPAAAAPAPLPGSNAAVAEKVAEGTKRNQHIALGLGALALLGLGTAIITR